jgi:hypothetical protein
MAPLPLSSPDSITSYAPGQMGVQTRTSGDWPLEIQPAPASFVSRKSKLSVSRCAPMTSTATNQGHAPARFKILRAAQARRPMIRPEPKPATGPVSAIETDHRRFPRAVHKVLIKKQYVRSGDPHRVCQARQQTVKKRFFRVFGNEISTRYKNDEPKQQFNIRWDQERTESCPIHLQLTTKLFVTGANLLPTARASVGGQNFFAQANRFRSDFHELVVCNELNRLFQA